MLALVHAESLGLGALEQRLPPLEQRLQLLARAAVLREHVDVTPVGGESALQVGHSIFTGGDFGLQPLELRRPLRLRPRWPRRAFFLLAVLRLRRRRRQLVAPADVVGPAAVV